MSITTEGMVGLSYVEGKSDCYALMRDFYSTNYAVNMPDYARPHLWWVTNPELDLLRTHLATNGFEPYDHTPRNMRPGDGLLMQLGGCTVLNHCGVYLGNGRFLHHPFRAKSAIDLLAGPWADRVMVYCRHKEIVHQDVRPTIDFMELLPNQKREAYRAALAQRGN